MDHARLHVTVELKNVEKTFCDSKLVFILVLFKKTKLALISPKSKK